jgi:hypothetical protein
LATELAARVLLEPFKALATGVFLCWTTRGSFALLNLAPGGRGDERVRCEIRVSVVATRHCDP